jgi:betaine lipid synthase
MYIAVVGIGTNCVNRVNMYASTWICTKEVGLEMDESKAGARKASLAELRLEGPAMRME